MADRRGKAPRGPASSKKRAERAANRAANRPRRPMSGPRSTMPGFDVDAGGSSMEPERGIDPVRAVDPSNLLARQDWDLLRGPLAAAGVDVDSAIARLHTFSAMLISWNRSFSNLISRNDEGRLVSRHLLESVSPMAQLMKSGATDWLDLGSGGGFPALVLRIAGSGGRWTLVESRRTKTLFLRRVVQELALDGVDIVNDRLENLVGAAGGPMFDGFTSRATLTLGPTLELAAPMVRPGGAAFLWKGTRRDEEMGSDTEWREAWTLEDTIQLGDTPAVVLLFRRK
jgi:16S rRNA (guanine527-N7)-methyltransferase